MRPTRSCASIGYQHGFQSSEFCTTSCAWRFYTRFQRCHTSGFNSTTQLRSGVLLKTAIAKVTSGIYTSDANILFDEGVQRSFVTRELADKLQLQTSGTEVVQLAAFGSSSKKVSQIDTATVYLLTDSREKIAIDVLIVPTVAVPFENRQRNAVSLPYLRGLKLAHPLTGEDIFSISLLIGADKYWDIVGNSHSRRRTNGSAVKDRLPSFQTPSNTYN